MSTFFDRLEVYGYSEDQESVVLAALLTGEPLLMIADIGSAKTTIARKLGQCLHEVMGTRYARYNAAHDQFDDLIGYPHPGKMREGIADYIPTPVTIWGKDFVFVDEVNRPLRITESKWLSFFDDREMVGRKTGARWIFSAMNPLSVEGTNAMGEATLGRFASFLWVVEFNEMSTSNRLAVIRTMNSQNVPALETWSDGALKAEDNVNYKECGNDLVNLLKVAAGHYASLEENSLAIDYFIESVSKALYAKTKTRAQEEVIKVDGRRAGLLRRLCLAVRAIDLAKANVLGRKAPSLPKSVKTAVRHGLPLGVNSELGLSKDIKIILDEEVDRALHFLDEDADLAKLELYNELLTTLDPFRQMEILLANDVGEIVKSSAWNRITKVRGYRGYLVGFIGTQLAAAKPGSIPDSAVDSLARMMDESTPLPKVISLAPSLKPYEKEITGLLKQNTVMGNLLALHEVAHLVEKVPSKPSPESVKSLVLQAQENIKGRLEKSRELVEYVESTLGSRGSSGGGNEGRPERKALGRIRKHKASIS